MWRSCGRSLIKWRRGPCLPSVAFSIFFSVSKPIWASLRVVFPLLFVCHVNWCFTHHHNTDTQQYAGRDLSPYYRATLIGGSDIKCSINIINWRRWIHPWTSKQWIRTARPIPGHFDILSSTALSLGALDYINSILVIIITISVRYSSFH